MLDLILAPADLPAVCFKPFGLKETDLLRSDRLWEPDGEYGAFLIYCSTRNDAVGEALTVILQEVNRFREQEVCAEELEAAKNQYLNSFCVPLCNRRCDGLT